ncbi:MAG: hypothetical protein HYX92_22130 [Chloroflexi bacterium]|nr:hypothetical protein [Chloroflexota bacterium]
MSHRLFPQSFAAVYRGVDVEVVASGAFEHPHLLDQIREQVLNVAALSRGWDDPQGSETLRRNFKIGPLYEANALMLIRRNGSLVGLVGSVNNWHVDSGDKTIVHMCCLALQPEVQNRGFLQVSMALLWLISQQNDVLRRNYSRQRVYISAITQSPYILAYLQSMFDVYPSPYRARATPDMTNVAQRVARRFDEHVAFDPSTFILRKECNFFYKRIPYSSNPDINHFCDQNLRYDQGDVFVVIGNVIPSNIDSYIQVVSKRYADLFNILQDGLKVHGADKPGAPRPHVR